MVALHYSALIYLLCSLLVSAKYGAQQKQDILNIANSKPGCPNKCGNVTIPYPFGIGSNCFLNPEGGGGFNLYCNASTDLPSIRLDAYELQIIEISESVMQVKTPDYTYPCDDKTSMTLNFSGSPYTLSEDNVVTQLGCSDLAVLEGLSSQYPSPIQTNNNFASGCVSFCLEGKQSQSVQEHGWIEIRRDEI